MFNKDFLKQVFANEKKLMKLSDLRTVVVPKFDELSVKNMFSLIQQDADVMVYFPDKYPKGREPDRSYTFNILHTVRPEYVQNAIHHAYSIRNTCLHNEMHEDEIHISKEWQE